MNALAMALEQAKREAAKPANDSADKAHVVTPTNVTVENGFVVPRIRIADLQGAKLSKPNAKTGKQQLGFMLDAFTFQHDGVTYKLRPGWVSIVAQV